MVKRKRKRSRMTREERMLGQVVTGVVAVKLINTLK